MEVSGVLILKRITVAASAGCLLSKKTFPCITGAFVCEKAAQHNPVKNAIKKLLVKKIINYLDVEMCYSVQIIKCNANI
jgi:hypothetical protein